MKRKKRCQDFIGLGCLFENIKCIELNGITKRNITNTLHSTYGSFDNDDHSFFPHNNSLKLLGQTQFLL